MKTTLRTDITIADIIKDFEYNELDEKGCIAWACGNANLSLPATATPTRHCERRQLPPVIASKAKQSSKPTRLPRRLRLLAMTVMEVPHGI